VVLQKIERNGVLIDSERLGQQSHDLGKRMLESNSRPTTWPASPST
jgi:DNA polymerase I-like protein with 3'-5' exonuclease and polymerase domains